MKKRKRYDEFSLLNSGFLPELLATIWMNKRIRARKLPKPSASRKSIKFIHKLKLHEAGISSLDSLVAGKAPIPSIVSLLKVWEEPPRGSLFLWYPGTLRPYLRTSIPNAQHILCPIRDRYVLNATMMLHFNFLLLLNTSLRVYQRWACN